MDCAGRPGRLRPGPVRDAERYPQMQPAGGGGEGRGGGVVGGDQEEDRVGAEGQGAWPTGQGGGIAGPAPGR